MQVPGGNPLHGAGNRNYISRGSQLLYQRAGLKDMATNSFNRGTFGLLPEPEGRMGSFGVATIINISLAAVLLLLTIAQVHQVQEHRYETTQLIFPVEQPKPYVPPVPKVT